MAGMLRGFNNGDSYYSPQAPPLKLSFDDCFVALLTRDLTSAELSQQPHKRINERARLQVSAQDRRQAAAPPAG